MGSSLQHLISVLFFVLLGFLVALAMSLLLAGTRALMLLVALSVPVLLVLPLRVLLVAGAAAQSVHLLHELPPSTHDLAHQLHVAFGLDWQIFGLLYFIFALDFRPLRLVLEDLADDLWDHQGHFLFDGLVDLPEH